MKIKLENYAAVLILGISLQADADVCPLPPSSIDPILSATSTFDKKTGVYKYQYSIKNGANAQIPLVHFGLYISQAPDSFISGKHWKGNYVALGFLPPSIQWSTVEIANPNRVNDNDPSIPEPLYDIKPNSSLNGFEILSSQPPGIVQFFAEGFTQPRTIVPTEDNDEPAPTCVGWSLAGVSNHVVGMTIGPSDPSIANVQIRVREETGQMSRAPIESKNPNGKIAVLVLSTKTFDASTINPAATYFGPGYALPISSKLLPTGLGEKLDRDERNDWEKLMESQFSKPDNRKDAYPNNMLLVFNVADLDVQCKLDQALVLRGNTTSGQQFIAGASANVAGCGPYDIGQHKKHYFPIKWWKVEKQNQ